MKEKKLSATIQFLQKTSILVKNFKDHRPIESSSDLRLKENRDVLAWFLQWEKTAKGATNLMSAECREYLSWMVIGFEHFVKRMTQKKVPIPPCDINSDITENFFCSQRGIQGGSKTNPSMHNCICTM